MNLPTIRLKSAKISQLLLWLLRIALVFAALDTILRLILIVMRSNSPTIAGWRTLLMRPNVIVSLVTLVILVIWIYRLHEDLRQCYPHYPINGGDALARIFLPVYNIWGIWNMLMTIALSFKAEPNSLHHYGLFLRRLVYWIYGVAIALILLDKLIYKERAIGRIEFRNLPESVMSGAIALKEILGVVGTFVVLAIAQTIVKGIQLKVQQINHTNSSMFSEEPDV